MADLRELIDAFSKAKAAYDVLADEDNDLVADAYEAAERAIIVHPCRSVDEIHLKAHFFLDEIGPNDTLRNCRVSSGSPEMCIDLFLRSLLGEASHAPELDGQAISGKGAA